MITINSISDERVREILSNKVFGVNDPVKVGDEFHIPLNIESALAPRISSTEYTVAVYNDMVTKGELSPKAAKAFVTSDDGLLKIRTSPYVVIVCTDGKELALGTLTSYATCNTAEQTAAADAKAKEEGKECIALKGAAQHVLNGVESYAGKTLKVVYREKYDQVLNSGKKLKDMTITAFVEA